MKTQKRPFKLQNEDGSMTIHLKEQIENGSEIVSQLILKKPKAKHIRHVDLGHLNMDQILKLAGKLCGEPPHVLDELGMEDLMVLSEVISDFLGGGDEVGSPT